MSYRRLLSGEFSDEKSGHLNNQSTFIAHVLLHPITKITILLVILILSLFNLPISIIQLDSRSCVSKASTEDTVPTIFTQDKQFQSLDHSFDHLWSELSMNKTTAGLIYTGKKGNRKEQGGISMFHQLHCLTMMRQALQSASEGEDIGKDWHDDGHWPHCMDYLAKMILCFADGSIEKPIQGEEGIEFIDGSNVVRQCRPAQPL
ncbi:hypothetical protein ASPACDRAFT_1890748, partial [Aspergillus aculeatus ATCC 16872]